MANLLNDTFKAVLMMEIVGEMPEPEDRPLHSKLRMVKFIVKRDRAIPDLKVDVSGGPDGIRPRLLWSWPAFCHRHRVNAVLQICITIFLWIRIQGKILMKIPFFIDGTIVFVYKIPPPNQVLSLLRDHPTTLAQFHQCPML
jgi:hypothetical protein